VTGYGNFEHIPYFQRMWSPEQQRSSGKQRRDNDDPQAAGEGQSPPFTSISVSSREVLNELSFGMSNMISAMRSGGAGSSLPVTPQRPRRGVTEEYGDDDSISIMSPLSGGAHIRSAEPTPDRLRNLQATLEAETRRKKEKRVSFSKQRQRPADEEGSVNDMNSVSQNSFVSVENIFESSIRDLVEEEEDFLEPEIVPASRGPGGIGSSSLPAYGLVRTLFQLPGNYSQGADNDPNVETSASPTIDDRSQQKEEEDRTASSRSVVQSQAEVAPGSFEKLKRMAATEIDRHGVRDLSIVVVILLFALTMRCVTPGSPPVVHKALKNQTAFSQWIHSKPTQIRTKKAKKTITKQKQSSVGINVSKKAARPPTPKKSIVTIKKEKLPIRTSSMKPLQSTWGKAVVKPFSDAQESHKKLASSYKSQLIFAHNETTSTRLSVPPPETPPLVKLAKATPSFLLSLPGKLFALGLKAIANIGLLLLKIVQRIGIKLGNAAKFASVAILGAIIHLGTVIGHWVQNNVQKPIKRTAKRTLKGTGEQLQSWADRLEDDNEA
jgi:hypothetical protein